MADYTIHQGDCLEVLPTFAASSIDACVTDPPYELGFMGKAWDKSGIAYRVDLWREVLRVLKPGGHLLAFGGSRTYHRLAVAIEDAGFEIRDQIQWIYGSGFPKSLDVSKALDKMEGAEREVLCDRVRLGDSKSYGGDAVGWNGNGNRPVTAPATEAAKQWEGWGTALKPAHEPICVARKPLEGTVAQNVLKWGVGALNIDGCRVEASDFEPKDRVGAAKLMEDRPWQTEQALNGRPRITEGNTLGRFPANVIHDGSDEVLAGFPQSNGGAFPKTVNRRRNAGVLNSYTNEAKDARVELNDSGSAARFFYTAKASQAERRRNGAENNHPTVKPIDLMRYLCRLVTPPAGLVLDPFNGSGSTGIAAITEGFNYLGIELQGEYVEISEKRLREIQVNLF